MGLEKIEEYKRRLGMTTAALAEKSGIPKGTLDKILSGVTKDPKLETLKAIARNGKDFSTEQKMRLIKLLSEID